MEEASTTQLSSLWTLSPSSMSESMGSPATNRQECVGQKLIWLQNRPFATNIEQYDSQGQYDPRGQGNDNLYNRPTTDFLGWRRLELNEILMCEPNDYFMIVIPASVKRDKSDVKAGRKWFLNLLISHVRKCVQTMSVDDTYEYLLKHHGVDQNRQWYIELACCVDSYPEQE